MNISSNYSKKDWKKLLASFGMIYFFVAAASLSYIEFILSPSLIIFNIVTSFLSQDHIAIQLAHYAFNYLQTSPTDTSLIRGSIHLIMTIILLIIGFMTPLYWIALKVTKLTVKLCKFLKINPVMNLIVFKNDRYWFKIQIGKLA